jgi:hypothetical protein
MDLIDRYLNAIKPFLPPDQRDDIIAELGANLHDEADERESELDRPLKEAELEAIIQAHGHPLTVAGRYQSGQGGLTFGRQLIGPVLFPLYLRVLWIVIAVGTVIHIGVLVALGVGGVPINSSDMVNDFFTQIFVQFAVITILFCVADRILPATSWRDLSAGRVRPQRRAPNRVSLVESIAQIVAIIAVAIIVVAIWLQVIHTHPESLVGSTANTYRLGSAWSAVVFPIALIFAANLIQAVINLARPDWTSLRAVTRVLTDLSGVAILLYLIFAGNLVMFAHPGAGDPQTLQHINQWVAYNLAAIALAFLIVAGIDFWRLRASLNWHGWLPSAM